MAGCVAGALSGEADGAEGVPGDEPERALGDERMVVTLNLRTLDGSVVDGSGRDRLREDDVLGVSPDQRPG